MAHLIPPLLELRELPANVHLLCPRQDEDDQDRYEEDIQGSNIDGSDAARRKSIEDARNRREKFISCLQLLAYDGNESEKYQRMIWETLDQTLGKCDICIRNYYIEKTRFLAKLREEYEEPDVQQFFGLIDRRDVARITKGLDAATRVLQALPEQKRGTSALDPAHLHALFEALLCDAFLRDEDLIIKHFDDPFRLIQTKKQLKIREILPSTVRFLFSQNHRRLNWATSTWGRLDRVPTELEWTWSIKDHLQERLHQCTDLNSIARFWSGAMVIVRTFSEDLITHKLFDLQPNLCRTALDHLHQQTSAVPFITKTLSVILTKAPKAFWQAIGAVSSETVVQQVFGSPKFDKALQDAAVAEQKDALDVLQWTLPFLESLEVGNQPAACQALTKQLFKRLHQLTVSQEAKRDCFEAAVKMMLKTAVAFSKHMKDGSNTERVVLLSLQQTISEHISDLLHPKHVGLADEMISAHARQGVLNIVRNAIALDCHCLRIDFDALEGKKQLMYEPDCYSGTIWDTVTAALDNGDTQMSTDVLLGLTYIVGLEQYRVRHNDPVSKQRLVFNSTFEKISAAVSKILEKLADFDPSHLDTLYSRQETSMTLVAALFSADEHIYQAAVDLIKNISAQPSRKEALTHLVDAFFTATTFSLSWTLRRIAMMGTFASVPRMVRTCMDVLDVLCNGNDGKLRKFHKVEKTDSHAIMNYWSYQWIALRTIFQKMEPWSGDVHDKPLMTEVCRDTMQFAQALFAQYHTFAAFLRKSDEMTSAEITHQLLAAKKETTPQGEKKDRGSPVTTLGVMAKWLRLRDPFLADTQVRLITNMLEQLRSHNVSVEIEGLSYVQEVATTTSIKTILSDTEKATLVRALENYTGKQIAKPLHKKKQTTLQMQQWQNSAKEQRSSMSASSSRRDSADEFGDDDIPDDEMYALSKNYANLQKEKAKQLSKGLPPRTSSIGPQKLDPIAARAAPKREDQAKVNKAFIEDRKRTQAALKQAQKESAAKTRGKTLGEGLGVLGKDHAVPAEASMMVSSDSESDSDEALFGEVKTAQGPGRPAIKKAVTAGPVRKIKQVRSQKDMRARLAPDLSSLHKTILAWDFFADTDLPPNSTKNDYTLVTNEFRTVQEYQKTFEPLLVLESWQSFRAAREDGTFKPFEIKIANSLLVDSFFELNVTMSQKDGQELGLGATDVVLLSKSERPTSDSSPPHCLARIKEITRKRGELHIVFRINAAANPLRPYLNDAATVWGAQILSLTTLEREYGALMALPYYDLSEEIIAAKPSPLLKYTQQELAPYIATYDVNEAQAQAIKSALDNDAFTLIQGPPGSGKTKTITGLVGAAMTGHLPKQQTSGPRLNAANGVLSAPKAAKKILVCAPSNAAVDELVMRFKDGLKLTDGSMEKINVVRLGRSDAINTNVKDVTLDELVNAKLNVGPKDQKEDVHAYMLEHKSVSNEVLELRSTLDGKRQRGEDITQKEEDLFDVLKRKKANLGTKIDNLKEKQNSESRNADLNRKRVQQEILDAAHVLCATLSGSGHEIFQSLNVEFETVIIDEAAQSIELSALIPLKYGCSKCILVGDPKQLPPTVLSREAARFQYEQSLFARMEKNHRKHVHLLDTQYRMHPEISLFPSRTFYDSRLKDGAGMAKLRARPWHHSEILAPYRFFDIQGMSESSSKGHSLINIAEINIAMALYDRLTTDVKKYNFRGKIGIITPYKGQLRELRNRFRSNYGEDITSAIEFNTTDAFQGRESEIIIFSCVRASTKGIGFLNDIRRMNVGLTRAKCSLWVLGNSQALNQGEFWRGLISDAKSRKLYTDGNIAALLKKQLLTEDMMKDDVEMMENDSPEPTLPQAPPSRTASTTMNGTGIAGVSRPSSVMSRKSSSSSVTSIPRPEPAVRRDSAKTALSNVAASNVRERSFSPAAGTAKAQVPERRGTGAVHGPSGGKHGLNTLAGCNICGSTDHFTFNCDNQEAQDAAIGNCRRCFEPGHVVATCKGPRCIECGEVGHEVSKCTAPAKLRLTEDQKAEIRRQEVRFKRQREGDIERRANKQLGDHAGKIPEVKATLPENTPTEPKRKREHSAGLTPGNAPKAPRVDGRGPVGPLYHQNGARPSMGGGPQQVVKKKAPGADALFHKRK